MTELKARHAFDVYEDYTRTGDDEQAQVYLKSEADEAIGELNEKLHDAKTDVAWKDECLAQSYKRERELTAKLRHQKYKRCVAMAKACFEKWCSPATPYFKSVLFAKWEKKWLELADKLTEATS